MAGLLEKTVLVRFVDQARRKLIFNGAGVFDLDGSRFLFYSAFGLFVF